MFQSVEAENKLHRRVLERQASSIRSDAIEWLKTWGKQALQRVFESNKPPNLFSKQTNTATNFQRRAANGPLFAESGDEIPLFSEILALDFLIARAALIHLLKPFVFFTRLPIWMHDRHSVDDGVTCMAPFARQVVAARFQIARA